MSDQPTTQLWQPTAVLPRPPRRPSRLTVALAIAVAVLAVITISLVLVNLTGSPAPVAGSSPSATAPPAAAPSAPPAAPVIVGPARQAGPNECVDSTGEGGSVDLESVALQERDGELVVVFQLVVPPPPGESGLGVVAESANGKRSYLVATEWRDGGLERYFLRTAADEDQLAADSVSIEGSTVTLDIPDDVVDRLGRGWRWYAFSTAGAENTDACPGEIGSSEMLTVEELDDHKGNPGQN
jgi:hypothetical protein